MRLLLGVIACLLVLAPDLFSQGILYKEVNNFNGGLVNSLDNALMRDNQLSIFVNYDLDKNGDLVRRNGRTLHYIDPHSGHPMIALFPFYRGNSKSLLTIRKLDAYYGDDRDSLYVLTICDDAEETCTTVVYSSYMPFDRFVPARFNVTRTTMNQGLVIAATQSEAIVFDSLRAIPFRPRPGSRGTARSMGRIIVLWTRRRSPHGERKACLRNGPKYTETITEPLSRTYTRCWRPAGMWSWKSTSRARAKCVETGVPSCRFFWRRLRSRSSNEGCTPVAISRTKPWPCGLKTRKRNWPPEMNTITALLMTR